MQHIRLLVQTRMPRSRTKRHFVSCAYKIQGLRLPSISCYNCAVCLCGYTLADV